MRFLNSKFNFFFNLKNWLETKYLQDHLGCLLIENNAKNLMENERFKFDGRFLFYFYGFFGGRSLKTDKYIGEGK